MKYPWQRRGYLEDLWHSYEAADDSITWLERLFGKEAVRAQLYSIRSRPDLAQQICAGFYRDVVLEERFEAMDCLYPAAYIYNVGKREHVVRKGTAGTWTIPARKPDELFAGPLVIPGVIEESILHPDHSLKILRRGGTALAMDIVKPRLEKEDWSIGTNLGLQGVFWSNHPTPTAFEIERAYLAVKLA